MIGETHASSDESVPWFYGVFNSSFANSLTEFWQQKGQTYHTYSFSPLDVPKHAVRENALSGFF